jgi:hypothetical protein
MNIDTFEDTDINDNLNFDTGIAGFEIANGSISKKAIKQTVKQRYQIKEKLDFLNEQRFLDRQLNTLSDYWDM